MKKGFKMRLGKLEKIKENMRSVNKFPIINEKLKQKYKLCIWRWKIEQSYLDITKYFKTTEMYSNETINLQKIYTRKNVWT